MEENSKTILTTISTDASLTANSPKATVLRFNINQHCGVEYVTVYNDRAEVTRVLKHHFDSEGIYDLILEGFSTHVDRSSLHVSGGTGKSCTILEVSYQTCYEVPTTNDDLTPLDQLDSELIKIQSEIDLHRKEVTRINKQRTWLDGRASKLMNQDGQIDTNNLEEMNKFMEFYHRNLKKLDEHMAIEQNEIKSLAEKQDRLKIKIGEHGVESQLSRRKERHEVTISVHIGSNNVDISLDLSYLINNCSWSASYDVRVSSIDISKPKTQLTYYGIIVNKSQENWSNVQLSLSTATPSLGGGLPKFGTLKIDFYQPVSRYVMPCSARNTADFVIMDQRSSLKMAALDDTPRKRKGFVSLKERSSLNNVENEHEDSPNIVNVLSATTEASMSSTSFSIPRRSTIDADGKPHKVTISVLDLSSIFIHTVIPKLSLHAYLKASTTNTSDKQLLAGPVSVFMDNNFVAHSSINNVCLGDTFDLSLGTDATVKVEYTPLKKVADTQGFISKTHHEKYQRETRLVNTKSNEVTVYVYEQVPLATDEKIKVKLIKPDLRKKDQNITHNVTMNDRNNLEWKCVLQSKGECRLPIEYTLEWPEDRRVEFKEQLD